MHLLNETDKKHIFIQTCKKDENIIDKNIQWNNSLIFLDFYLCSSNKNRDIFRNS